MPKVPKYSASIDQKVVPSGPRRNVAQAGMIGRAIAGFGQTVSKVVRAREQTLVRDYMTGLLGWQQEFDAEYQSRKGSDAWGIADELKNEYEGRYKGIDKLSWSSGAKDALKRKVTVFRDHAINKASVYVSVQDRVFKIKADENKARQTVDYAQANYNNLTLIDELLSDYEVSANDTYYDELAEAKIQAVKDKVWDVVITRAMLDDPELAKEILKEHRDDLSADTEERLDKAIKTALEQQDTDEKKTQLYGTLYQKHDGDSDDALKDLEKPDLLKKYGPEVIREVKLMFRGIRADESQREDQAKEEKVKSLEQVQNDFSTRLNDPKKPDPTVDEIMASSLEPFGQGSKDTFVKMIEAKAAKNWKVTADQGFYNTKLEDAYEGGVDPKEPLAWAGNQISGDDAEHIRKIAMDYRDESKKHELELRKMAIKTGRDMIIKGTILTGFEATEVRDAYLYEHALRQALEQGKTDEKSVVNMLTPGNKDYIVEQVLGRYLKTPLEQLREKAGQLEKKEKPKFKAGEVPKRKKGETIEQYLKRTGL